MTEDLQSKTYDVIEEVYNKKNLDALDTLYSTDLIRHHPPFPDLVGLDALKEYVKSVFETYPDFHIEIDEMVICDDVGAARFSWTATNLGRSESFNLEATGKKVKVFANSFCHFVDGKVAEEWISTDFYGLMQQLGVIAAIGEPA